LPYNNLLLTDNSSIIWKKRWQTQIS